ncbi:MAG: hypothetical protein HFH06_06945 [Lachnospiraceae bacterium]|nr:hypothetical protein [Lachnospiraceae bacterium]
MSKGKKKQEASTFTVRVGKGSIESEKRKSLPQITKSVLYYPCGTKNKRKCRKTFAKIILVKMKVFFPNS